MRHYSATLTMRGQVTLPAEIRKMLGVRPRDTVTFDVEGDNIRIVPSTFSVETVRGSVPALTSRRTPGAIEEIAADEHARHVLDEMRRARAFRDKPVP